MLDPNRYSLDAATVGFRKRMHQSVDWSSFNDALQTQSESIKVRRELQETPVTEIHVMGGQGFGVAGNQKTNEMERQARQMNGYVLRSFLATGGAVVLPTKHGEGLMATPQNLGLPQYTQYNGVMGNYVSSFTEPLNAPMDSGSIALARMGIQAKSESATNPFKFLQFQLNMHNTQEQIRELEEKHLQLRGYNQEGSIQKAYQADMKARRGGKKQSRAVARHQAATTPSAVRNAVQGLTGGSTPLTQAILATLSENVLVPGNRQPEGELDPYDFNERSVAELEESKDMNMADYDSYTPARTPATYLEGEGRALADNLQEEFPGVSRDYINTIVEVTGGDNLAEIRNDLRRAQEFGMYGVAENQNIAVSTNAVTESLGLEQSDSPFFYKNTIDPEFEQHVENVVSAKKNLFQNSTVNNLKDLRPFESPPFPASYSNSLMFQTPAQKGSSSVAPALRVSDGSSLANVMNTSKMITSLSPNETFTARDLTLEMEEEALVEKFQALKKRASPKKQNLRTKEQRRPSAKLRDK